jgi:hypothetical protein
MTTIQDLAPAVGTAGAGEYLRRERLEAFLLYSPTKRIASKTLDYFRGRFSTYFAHSRAKENPGEEWPGARFPTKGNFRWVIQIAIIIQIIKARMGLVLQSHGLVQDGAPLVAHMTLSSIVPAISKTMMKGSKASASS